MSIGGVFRLTGGQLVSPGDLSLTGSFQWGGGNISLASGANLFNRDGAAIEIADAVTASITGAAGTIGNEGTFTKDFASNITIEPAFANTGRVTVRTGGSLDFAGGFTQTAGTLEIESIATVESAIPLLVHGGNLAYEVGSNIAADVAVSGASIRPESLLPGGSLDIDGDLNVTGNTSWMLRIGSRFDSMTGEFIGYEYNSVSEAGVVPLNLNGSTLDIASNWIFHDERQPEPTDTFTILRSNQPITGTFGNQNAGTGRVFFEDNGSSFRGGSFLVTKAGNDLVLTSFAPALIQENNAGYVWTGANGDTDWDSPANWDTFSVPRANSLFETTGVFLAGGTVRKAGGTISLSSLSIGDGRLILTDGAEVDPSTEEILIGEDGILQLGESGAPPASLGALVNIRGPASGSDPGRVVIDHNGALSVGSDLSGALSLSHEGEGITNLGGNRAFSTTTVKGGLLGMQASTAHATSALPLLLDGGGLRYNNTFNNLRAFTIGLGGGTLNTNGFSPSYAHVIPSTGPFFKDGAGTLTLSQPHTVSTEWTVLAGNLAFGSSVTFASGSRLAGAGDVDIAGGTTTFQAGSVFALEGNLNIAGGSLALENGASLKDFALGGGTMTFGSAASLDSLTLTGGILNGPGAINVNGPMIWSGGQIQGFNNGAVDVINAKGGLTFSGGGFRTITARTINHGDGINPATGAFDAGTLFLQAGSIFNNLANATLGTAFDNSVEQSGGGVFNNSGIFTKSGGTGTTTFNSVFNNTGTVNIASGRLLLAGGGTHSGALNIGAGSTLSFGSGTHSLGAATTITDTSTSILEISSGVTTITPHLTLAGTLRVNGGQLNLSDGASLNALELLGTTLVGTGAINVSGPMTWTGGNLQGSNPATDVINLFGGATFGGTSKFFPGRTINHGDGINPSLANWTGGLMIPQTGSAFNNAVQATLETNFDGAWAGGGAGPFNNAGTFTKNGGTGNTTMGVFFDNSGMINVTSGTLLLDAGSTHTGAINIGPGARPGFGSGSHVIGPAATFGDTPTSVFEIFTGTTTFNRTHTQSGTFRVSGGRATFNETADLQNLELLSGIVNGPATITAQGAMTWSAGNIGGTASDVLNAFGGLTINGGTKILTTRVFNHGDGTNPSNAIWSGGWFFMQGGSTFNNRPNAIFETVFDEQIASSSGSVFNNAGTYQKSAGAGTNDIQPVFNNTGTVRAKSGTIAFSGDYNQTAGALLLEGGSVTKSGGSLNIQGGVVAGSGMINGSIILGPTAQLLPGSSTGILTIGGNFHLSGGSVVLEIGGTTQGTDYDQLNINGALQYASGVIELAFIGGFAPQQGQSFDVIDSGSSSGTPQIVVRGLEPGWEFSAVRDPATGILTITSLNDGTVARPLQIVGLEFSAPPPASSGKTVSIIARGAPGSHVRLEASDALSGWETISTVILGEDGTANIEVHDENAGAKRFYRLASP